MPQFLDTEKPMKTAISHLRIHVNNYVEESSLDKENLYLLQDEGYLCFIL